MKTCYWSGLPCPDNCSSVCPFDPFEDALFTADDSDEVVLFVEAFDEE